MSSLFTKRTRKFFPLLTLPLAVSGAWAANLDYDKVFLREYLDLAQNKGQFQAGATDVRITRKDGSQLILPALPIPDFSPSAKKGATTSIGGGFYVSATHNREDFHAIKTQTWGNSEYHHVPGWENNGDFSAGRLDKFVVETEGLTDFADTTLTQEAFIKRYGIDYDGKKRIMGYRVGSGRTIFNGPNGKFDTTKSYEENLLSGSLFELTSSTLANNRVTDLRNTTEGGDSGSGFYIYDNQLKKWVLYGTLYGIVSDSNNSSIVNIVDKNTIDRLKDKYTENVALGGKTAEFVANALTIGSTKLAGTGKDWKLTGGGEITVKDKLELGVGGLIFDEGQDYTVKSADQNDNSFKGAGVDVGANTTVHWYVKGTSGDNLHKIGKGTLEVNVAQGNNLKTGDGTVVLKAENAFNDIYITSGRGTVKLEHDKALKQTGFGGIYFGERGGKLDLNGHNQTFEKIAANDAGAVITNSNQLTKSTVSINAVDKYIYHGGFEGNLDVRVEKAAMEAKDITVFDGGMKTTGTVSVSNTNLVMQGHATTHAIFREGGVKCLIPQLNMGCDPDYVYYMNQADKAVAEAQGRGDVVSNKRSTFSQPDWDLRHYKFQTLELDNATLGIGHASLVEGDINAKNSTVTFGGNVKAYIDEHDGANLTNGGFGFRQNVLEGDIVSTNPVDTSVRYRGHITAQDSTFKAYNEITEASFNFSGTSTYEAMAEGALTRLIGNVSAADTSSIKLKTVTVVDQTSPITVNTTGSGSISMNNLHVSNGNVTIGNATINGNIRAEKASSVTLGKWTFNNNLSTDTNSHITANELTVADGSRVFNGNLQINTLLDLGSIRGPAANGAIGLHANNLTLGANSSLKAELTADALSLNNFEFKKGYDLLTADTLVDNRTDKKLDLTKTNAGIFFSTATVDNRIELKFYDKEPQDMETLTPSTPVTPPTPGPNPDPTPNPVPPPPTPTPPPGPSGQTDAERYEAVMAAYHAQYGRETNTSDLISAILENNKAGTNKYQEVALRDALLNSDAQAGADALHQIVRRSRSTFDAMSRTANPQQLFQPVRLAVDSRLALSATDRAETLQREKFFIDTGAGYYDNGDRGGHLNYQQTALGWDTPVSTSSGSGLVGAMAGIGHTSLSSNGMTLSGEIYTLTGYGAWSNGSGVEVSNFLSFAYLDASRKVTPEIRLGMQKFDEKAYTVMNSTYVKRAYALNDTLTIKPMFSLDLAQEWTESTESAYFKRDGSTKTNAWLGLGAELDWKLADGRLYTQMLGRRTLTSTDHKVGVTLNGASTYIDTKMDDLPSFTYDLRLMYSTNVTENLSVNIGLGGTADNDGGLGAGGQFRLNYRY